ncbi:MAG: hypothetical protein A2017_05880 [Lentisphaerae bacterium GWF2_44_16]|nr:MAG: hypothetical protein A2017_05880 [Lentisphaerae bacterium GWF2_44_16]
MEKRRVRKKRENRKLSYSRDRSHNLKVSKRKKDRMGFLLRQIASHSRILRELKILGGEFALYKNRYRDCEYEVYKIRNVLKEKSLVGEAFLNDELK